MADVLYLDQPVGTGFSYGKDDSDVLTSIEDIAAEFVNFIDSFLTLYPEYAAPRQLVLAGEGTAGKFLPYFAKSLDAYIFSGGKLSTPQLVIGNPLVSNTLQSLSQHLPAKALSVIDVHNYDQLAQLHSRCLEGVAKDKGACTVIGDYISSVAAGSSLIDARTYTYEQDATVAPFIQYLTNSSVKGEAYLALHVDKSTKKEVF
jgi:carboxypeptidase C (cathepsin A)